MDIKELESYSFADQLKFHDRLNPELFQDEKLQPEVREQLLVIAQDFLEHLGVSELDVKDIIIIGSNVAYTYNQFSDIDLHILVDIGKLKNNDIYRELFNSKKVVYNDSHDIKIHGYDVELYVQDTAIPVKSLGEYSVLRDRWIKFPSKRRSNFDERAAREKFLKLVQLSELALRSKSLTKLENLLNTVKKYRQAGLEKHGEFGPENLAYKLLRSRGIVDKLYNHRDELHSAELSLEDFDPNAKPPGPEFKPTMPRGTVRVDVSDVYDWYKLGQHISNMKGLGKHDFGKGPPSTILSFGDEDTEHQYIKDLEKTGLTTTDIDPLDPRPPRGMRRQKVDTTYNVDEGRRNWDNWESKATDLPTLLNAFMNDLNRYFRGNVSYSDNEDNTKVFAKVKGKLVAVFDKETKQVKLLIGEASGYIPSKAEASDPRFKTALTVDVKPDSIKTNAKKLGLGNIHRSGVPQQAKSNGKIS